MRVAINRTAVKRIPNPGHDEISPEEWLRGYFNNAASDHKGAGSKPTAKWKNIDYLRLRDVPLHLLAPGPGRTILDIGCSNGATMIYCGLQGATVYGVDLNPTAVKAANEQLKHFNLAGEATVGDAMKLPFSDNRFDAVISNDFVEHITDATKVVMLSEARRVLRPGAPLITRTPNFAYLEMSLMFKRLRALTRLENPFKYVIPHTPGTEHPEHIGLTTRWGFSRSLMAAGFLNYEFFYAPLRRFNRAVVLEYLSTEVPFVRDIVSEDLICRAYKPIALSHFPD